MILVPVLLMTGLLVLAAYGCYVLVMGLFSPWHLLILPATVLAILVVVALLFRLLWLGIPALIDRLRKPPA